MHREPNEPLMAAHKRQLLVDALDQLCRELDLTKAQYEVARERYRAVGEWLTGASSPYLQDAMVYPHGSIGAGTAIKPIASNEFDVDLMCKLPSIGPASSPQAVKVLIGARLREHGKYDGMLEEKTRCWRINYANEFHLDITPSIANPYCDSGGELVPDKQLASWKPTNPTGYLRRFESYAELKPKFYLHDALLKGARADIQPLPDQPETKSLLKLVVQVLKRHRDFEHLTPAKRDVAPISIIITTLAAWSYADCVRHRTYNNAFDLLVEVIERMPIRIVIEQIEGRVHYLIENETTTGENFADNWNRDPRLAPAFFVWHRNALAAIKALPDIEGLDQFAKHLSTAFGATPEQIKRSVAPVAASINVGRLTGALFVAPSLGVVSSPAAGGVTVRTNTFFGR